MKPKWLTLEGAKKEVTKIATSCSEQKTVKFSGAFELAEWSWEWELEKNYKFSHQHRDSGETECISHAVNGKETADWDDHQKNSEKFAG